MSHSKHAKNQNTYPIKQKALQAVLKGFFHSPKRAVKLAKSARRRCYQEGSIGEDKAHSKMS